MYEDAENRKPLITSWIYEREQRLFQELYKIQRFSGKICIFVSVLKIVLVT